MFPQNPVNIDGLKPRAKPYKVFLGGGLFIYVPPTGNKYWRFKYRIDGREKQLAIGVYPHIPLEAALKARDEAKALLLKGGDPSVAKRKLEAKDKPKPKRTGRSFFRFDLTHQGALTVETSTRLIYLTPPQTEALRTFLFAAGAGEKSETSPC